MRVLMIILATIFLLGSVGLGAIGVKRGIQDGDAIAEAGPLGEEILGTSASRLRAAGAVMGLVGLIAFGVLIFTFLKRPATPKLAIALIGVAAVAIFVSPHYDTGSHGPASQRQLSYILMGLSAAGGLLALFVDKLRNRGSNQIAAQAARA